MPSSSTTHSNFAAVDMSSLTTFHVVKRNGKSEEVSFDKVIRRIRALCDGLSHEINPLLVAQKVVSQIYDGVKTTELDELAAQVCISLETTHLDYGKLASRIIISNNHKNTSPSFSETIYILYHNKDVHGTHCPLIAEDVYHIIMTHKSKLNDVIVYERDYLFDYFGFKTLEKAYLMRSGGRVIERIQHLIMRVSVGIHKEDIKSAIQSYQYMSQKYFTHATPTLFNAGTPRMQLSSCFLLGVGDSVDGLYKASSDMAKISANAGGIGICLTDIRSKGTYIRGVNGTSNGIIPYCRVLNEMSRHINQAGKRPGSIACYLEPHHPEVLAFLDLRKNTGAEHERCRDLFTALWISDLFMKRVEANEMWSLFDPDECPGLSEAYGDAYEELYAKYEMEGKAKGRVEARKVWNAMLTSQIETGTPYIGYKDHVNRKSNQKNVGTIKNSNLCVVGETKILTRNGFQTIKDLAGQIVDIWNGKEWSNSLVAKTGENQKIIKIITDDGCELECTEYHKFYIQLGYTHNNIKTDIINTKHCSIIEAKDLKKDMKLIKCEYPVIDNTEHPDNELFKHAYTAGFFTGDGTYLRPNDENRKPCGFKSMKNSSYCTRHKKYHKDGIITDKCQAMSYETSNIVTLYGEKINLLEHLEYTSHGEVHYSNKHNQIDQNKRLGVQLTHELPEKYTVPVNCSISTKIKWFEGLCDSDGCLIKNEQSYGIQIGSIHKEFLVNVKLMLQTLGCHCKISNRQPKEYRVLPDGKGSEKEYLCEAFYLINIGSHSLNQLKNLGFSPKRFNIDNTYSTYSNASHYVKIKEVIDEGRISDTYCFNEPLRHAGIFNGILTGNCNEISEVSNTDEYAVCNLASISLPQFVLFREDGSAHFDYEKLVDVSKVVIRNLNKVIDVNYYPVPETKKSNSRMRPVGLGIQGLADVFAMMRLPFDSAGAREVNKKIAEAMYYGAVYSSWELACEEGAYSEFAGSPISEGKFQFDLWNVKPSNTYDWETLRQKVMRDGVRNSLLIALMPTASTSQILGNNECFEPYTSNMYTRRTIAGDFVVINKHLVKDLMRLGIWNVEMKNKIIAANGSVQKISEIPQAIRDLYKTVWEIKQKVVMDLAIDRSPFVCQTSSMNLFFEEPTHGTLTSAFMYGWRNGLKTGIYYLRTRPKVQAQQFTIDPSMKRSGEEEEDGGCTMCSA